MPVTCPYCGDHADLATGEDVYPGRPDLRGKKFWRCTPCDAYVGCHGSGSTPLGRLANAELRLSRRMAHDAFDPLWRCRGGMSRSEAYAWLADALKVPRKDCHVALFDAETCRRVVAVVAERRRKCPT